MRAERSSTVMYTEYQLDKYVCHEEHSLRSHEAQHLMGKVDSEEDPSCPEWEWLWREGTALCSGTRLCLDKCLNSGQAGAKSDEQLGVSVPGMERHRTRVALNFFSRTRGKKGLWGAEGRDEVAESGRGQLGWSHLQFILGRLWRHLK